MIMIREVDLYFRSVHPPKKLAKSIHSTISQMAEENIFLEWVNFL